MPIDIHNIGLHAYRCPDNPEEQRFAEAWARCNHLPWLLDERTLQTGRPVDPSERDEKVAATVIQWLGSPVGQAFLADLGYKRTDPLDNSERDE
jgi:hypothetical protein